MTYDEAAIGQRAELARQVLAWMNEAFAAVDFDAPPERVVERLTLAWSVVLQRVEAVDEDSLVAQPSPRSVHKLNLLTGIAT